MGRLRLGMVGGGAGAFIGAVHRMAAALDGEFELVSGALSSTPERSLASGRELGLERAHASWREMLAAERELPEGRRIDAVSIVTPNDSHFAIADAFCAAGFNIICDKPLARTVEEAGALVRRAREAGVVFCVTYNYSGYPMVKQARAMTRAGELGPIRKVIVEYNQGWLASALEAGGHKQAAWRTDPERSGLGGAIGDIGSHAEHLISYVAGLEVEAICADLTAFVPGRRLDDDANMLLRFAGGARGVLVASQVEVGQDNDLRLRIWGERAGLEWSQESPDDLWFRPIDGPSRLLRRGHPYLCPEARAASRLPPGHPEAFIEAFANIYRGAAAAIRARAGSEAPADALDYPDVVAGARGVQFIQRAVESARSREKWTPAAFGV